MDIDEDPTLKLMLEAAENIVTALKMKQDEDQTGNASDIDWELGEAQEKITKARQNFGERVHKEDEWQDMTRQAEEGEQGCQAKTQDGEKCGTIATTNWYEYNEDVDEEFWLCQGHFTQKINQGLGKTVEKAET